MADPSRVDEKKVSYDIQESHVSRSCLCEEKKHSQGSFPDEARQGFTHRSPRRSSIQSSQGGYSEVTEIIFPAYRKK